ncbi:MAG: TRAP transporter substrate-binding protein [Elainellaceae cyanobacterium]
MATSVPETIDIVFSNIQRICDRVRELTKGNFVITAFPAGGIAPPLEIMDTVQQGNVECGHTTSIFYIAKNPAFAFATGVPFGLNSAQQMAWLYGGGGLQLIQELYTDFNIINFPAGSTGNQMGGWFKRKIQSLSDLRGLKMRMPGLGGEVLKRLGAEVQVLPPNEILPALERNDIDAAEWIGPYDDERLGFNKVAPFYYYPGWHEPGSTYDLLINQTAWNQLPSEYQQALEVATYEAYLTMLSQYRAVNREALQRLTSSGTELTSYSKEILDGAQQATFEFYEEFAGKDSSFRKVYSQWNTFREGIYQWDSVNERSFAEFAFPDS